MKNEPDKSYGNKSTKALRSYLALERGRKGGREKERERKRERARARERERERENYRNWLTRLWKLRSPTFCHLQAGEPGKLVV